MSISSVKNPTISLLSHPSPRFSVVAFYPLHQDRHVIVKVAVHISFIPGFEFTDSRHNRMLRIDDVNGEIPYSMRFKLTSHGFYEPIGIPETKGSTVDRY